MYVRREPAIVAAVIVGIVQVLSALVLRLTDEQQAAVNAAAAIVAGLVTAAMVSLDKAVPLVGGVVQAMFAVGIAFGWESNAVAQSSIMALVAALVAAFTRTQVTVDTSPVESNSRE